MAHNHLTQQLVVLINEPGFRTGLYFMLAAETHRVHWRMTDRTSPYFVELLNIGSFPWARHITKTCRAVWPQSDQAPAQHAPLHQIMLGSSLAVVSLGSLLAIEASMGWIERRGWGWQTAPLRQIGAYGLFFGLGHAAVAYDEEMLFRGYGFDVLSQTFGPWIAAGGLIPMFVLIHQPFSRPRTAAAAYGLFAFNMHMVRMLSGSIAVPIAYHATWNWLQHGVFGAQPAVPSLIPVSISGPEAWTGKLGEAAPGLLMVLVQGVLAIILGWLGYKQWDKNGIKTVR